MRGLIALAVLAALPGWVGAELEPQDQEAQLMQWLEDPLDLRSATVDEMSHLPWLSLADAQRIEGLREAGGLRALGDLEQAGLDAVTRRAIEPFVMLPEATPVHWGSHLVRRTGPDLLPDDRADRRVTAGDLRVRVQARSRRSPRATVVWGERLWVGDLVPLVGSGLLLADPRARGGTAPVRFSSSLRLAGSTSTTPGWRGGALHWSASRAELLAATDVSTPRGTVALQVRGSGHQLGVGWVGEGRGRVGMWWRGQHQGLDWGSEWVPRPRGTSLATVAARVRRGASRAGASWTEAPAGSRGGRDPVTGQPLDRPHRAWQVWGRERLHPVSVGGLMRMRQRDHVASMRTDAFLEAPWLGGRMVLQGRLDSTHDQPTDVGTSVSWTILPAAGARVRAWARQRREGERRDDVAGITARVRRGAWTANLAVAFAGGGGSSYWAFGGPDGTVVGRWLRPGATGAAVGVAWRRGGVTLGGSAVVELDPATRPEHSLQIFTRSAGPSVVRRLQ